MFRKKLWDTFKIWRKGHAVYLRNKKEICSREDGICRVDKITVCGASNFLGQNLALLLKLSDSVKLLSLFDDENVHGIAADLEHINTKCKVKGYTGSQTAEPAFRVNFFFSFFIGCVGLMVIPIPTLVTERGHRGGRRRLGQTTRGGRRDLLKIQRFHPLRSRL